MHSNMPVINHDTWNSTTDFEGMIASIHTNNGYRKNEACKRKMNLFLLACCRRIWKHIEVYPRLKEYILFAEKYVDGYAAKKARRRVLGKCMDELKRQPRSPHIDALLRISSSIYIDDDVYRNIEHACRSLASILEIEPASGDQDISDLVRCIFGNIFNDSQCFERYSTRAKSIVNIIYDNGCFHQMPILADLLEDDGCHDQELLVHCRTEFHAKGCWVLDRIKNA